jgi:hypothetical protein
MLKLLDQKIDLMQMTQFLFLIITDLLSSKISIISFKILYCLFFRILITLRTVLQCCVKRNRKHDLILGLQEEIKY